MTQEVTCLSGFAGPQERQGQAVIDDTRIVVAGGVGGADRRMLLLLPSVAGGLLSGAFLAGSAGASPALSVLCLLAFVGGLLSTWSPCGYSSLSLLRPVGPYGAAAVLRWLPTLAAHGLGYLLGGMALAATLGMAGWLLPVGGLSGLALLLIGGMGLAYGLHQLDLVRMPYPQHEAQVPHRARLRLPMWQIGLLYGWQLGLNFVTYVKTPILYLVVTAALLSGSLASALALLLSLNLGRFLPLLINALPLADWTIQRWMATHEGHARQADACVLLFGGGLVLILGMA
jgi:hypothetical protein